MRDRVQKLREAKEVEGLGLPFSTHLPLFGRIATKADQPGLVRPQGQFECTHPFREFVRNAFASCSCRKPTIIIVSITDDDHVA